MKPLCYLLHGIKTVDAKRSSISFLAHVLPKFRVVTIDYGYIPAIAAPIISLINMYVVHKVRKVVKHNGILIGHSNGCAVAYGVSKKQKVKGLVLVNPALNRDIKFPADLEFIHIYWSKKDGWAWLSKFVPFSIWGSMGAEGYSGTDRRVSQWEMGISHTDIGSAEIAVKWGPIIVENLSRQVIGRA